MEQVLRVSAWRPGSYSCSSAQDAGLVDGRTHVAEAGPPGLGLAVGDPLQVGVHGRDDPRLELVGRSRASASIISVTATRRAAASRVPAHPRVLRWNQ